MGFNSRYKPGPTLADMLMRGVTRITIKCLKVDCNREETVIIQMLKVRRNVPVNYLSWVCSRKKGGCGGDKIRVTELPPDTPEPFVQVLDVTKMKPRRRRCHCGG